MDVSNWYVILGVALILIAFGERFVIYKLLVGQSRWLPEKASKVANVSCVITLVAGIALICGNALLAKH
jgi:hypothetical protein